MISDRQVEAALNHIYGLDLAEFHVQRDIRGALEAADDAGWEPIETAPTNGRHVLVLRNRIGEEARIAFWDEPRGGQWSMWPGRERIEPDLWRPIPQPPAHIR